MNSILLLLVKVFSSVPAPLAVVIISALPIAEVRGGIVVALTVYHMSVVSAIFWAALGNIIAVAILLILLEDVSNWLRRHFVFWERFFTWLFDHTRARYHAWIIKYGAVALFIIAAIPFPPTGAWSAVAAAFIAGLPKKKSFIALTLGIIVSALLATTLTLGLKSSTASIR